MKPWFIRSVLIGIGIGVLFAAAAAWYGSQRTLPEGMSVSGWQVGGWEREQFEKGLAEQVALLRGKEVALTAKLSFGGHSDTRSVALGELGLATNAEFVAAEVERLFLGPVWERALLRWQWRNRALTLELGLEEKAFAVAAKKAWPELYASQPKDAKRTIAAGDRVVYTHEVPALRLDEAGLRGGALAALAEAAGAGTGAGAPALGANGLFAAPEALRPDGRLLAAAPLQVAAPTFELAPKVTVASLKAQGIERVIASYSTSFATSGSGRKHNVAKTASVVHDRLLAPGDVFDYAKIIDETEKLFGFREAPVILNGKLVPGVGGGICQVSTTLYNAVLRAGLEIVERRNHSLPVSYAPLGQDATFASGYINFKFRNSTGKHLLIRTSSEGGKLTVKLFGTLDPDVTYEIKSVTLKEIPPGTKYVKNPSLPAGAVELLQRGKPGYVVETYRYKKIGGKIVEQERISKDTYKAQPALYASNAGEGGGDAPDDRARGSDDEIIIEDGVLAPAFEDPAEGI
ncbi:MAG TPA: VanW family protein [Paenibacillus sp.]|nr:VanW family protein [Paenibacillus sp.]